MSDVLAQLEAILAGIEDRMEHTEDCHWGQVGPGPALGCLCDRDGRVRTEQARTVERMVNRAANVSFHNSRRADEFLPLVDVWGAAFQAARPEEVK